MSQLLLLAGEPAPTPGPAASPLRAIGASIAAEVCASGDPEDISADWPPLDPARYAGRWPRVAARATPGGRVPIAEQAAARGVPVPVGSTAAVVAALGFDVPPLVEPWAVLRRDEEGVCERLETSSVGRVTGLRWENFNIYTAILGMAMVTLTDLARANNRELLAQVHAVLRCLPLFESDDDPEVVALVRAGVHTAVVLKLEQELDRREAAHAAEGSDAP